MASGKRTSKYTRRYNKKKGSSRRKDSEPLDRSFWDEFLMIGILGVCIFLFLCNFGIAGKMGEYASYVEFWLFGVLAYIAPIFIFFAVAFGVINRESQAAKRKLVASIILFVVVGMICEFLAGRVFDMSQFNLWSFGTEAVAHHSGGGIIAGSITYAALKYLSLVGSVLLIVIIALICFILITEKSLFQGVREGSRYASAAVENTRRRHEEREARRREEYEEELENDDELHESREEKKQRIEQEREERRLEKKRLAEERENEKILRMDRKSRGVMMDTTLSSNKAVVEIDPEAEKARDDMHEITINIQPEQSFKEQATEISVESAFQVNQHTPEAELFSEPVAVPENKYETKTPSSQEIFGEVKFEDDSIDDSTVYNAMPDPITELHPRSDETTAFGIKDDRDMAGQTEHRLQTSSNKATFTPPSNGRPISKYAFPPVSLLQKGSSKGKEDNAQQLKAIAFNLQNTLKTFGVNVKVTDISQGPAVTRYELQPEQGVKVSKIVNLADDIKLNLAATDIRIEAPIPGKAAVGIEVPNKDISMVAFRDLIESNEYSKSAAKLSFAVGKDIGGRVVVTDISKMPHLLIAGATGSGKSVCINTIIMSVLYKAKPDDVKMIMIDPKVVELSVYNGTPHLMLPVVTDPKKAAASLQWGVKEMTDRYQKFADFNVRDLKGFNKKVEEMKKAGDPEAPAKMPQILIIVDELADLMMVAPGEVEEAICRLAQLARAAGIHLIIATQRPSVDVITGLIKANMPSRIAFAVSSGVDSRTILDSNGAEKLLGKGDMLFYPQGYPKPLRIQGAFVSDNEVEGVVDFLKAQNIICDYKPDIEEQMKITQTVQSGSTGSSTSSVDDLFRDAGSFVIDKDKASIGMLQRVFKIGFNRAARIMDQLCEAGVVSEEDGTKPRKVLMGHEQFDSYIEETL